MKKKTLSLFLGVLGAVLFTPRAFAHATAPSFADWVNNTVVGFVDGYIIPLLYALTFLLFTFGIFRYFFTGGEENREKGKAFVLWSIIGMAAIFSIWGVVRLLVSVIPQ